MGLLAERLAGLAAVRREARPGPRPGGAARGLHSIATASAGNVRRRAAPASSICCNATGSRRASGWPAVEDGQVRLGAGAAAGRLGRRGRAGRRSPAWAARGRNADRRRRQAHAADLDRRDDASSDAAVGGDVDVAVAAHRAARSGRAPAQAQRRSFPATGRCRSTRTRLERANRSRRGRRRGDDAPPVPLLVRGKTPYAVERTYEGGGRAIVLADDRLLTNASLLVGDNALLLVELLRPGGPKLELAGELTGPGVAEPGHVGAARPARARDAAAGVADPAVLRLQGRALRAPDRSRSPRPGARSPSTRARSACMYGRTARGPPRPRALRQLRAGTDARAPEPGRGQGAARRRRGGGDAHRPSARRRDARAGGIAAADPTADAIRSATPPFRRRTPQRTWQRCATSQHCFAHALDHRRGW